MGNLSGRNRMIFGNFLRDERHSALSNLTVEFNKPDSMITALPEFHTPLLLTKTERLFGAVIPRLRSWTRLSLRH